MDTDEPAETPDWIELINPGVNPVPLSGLSITDDKYRPLRNPLPDVTLVAGQRLTLLADDDVGQNNLHPGTGPYHLKFALEKSGGFVGVYGGQGTVLIDSYQYNDAPVWGVFGRFPDGLDAASAWSSMLCPTYDTPNVLCDKLIFLPILRR